MVIWIYLTFQMNFPLQAAVILGPSVNLSCKVSGWWLPKHKAIWTLGTIKICTETSGTKYLVWEMLAIWIPASGAWLRFLDDCNRKNLSLRGIIYLQFCNGHLRSPSQCTNSYKCLSCAMPMRETKLRKHVWLCLINFDKCGFSSWAAANLGSILDSEKAK